MALRYIRNSEDSVLRKKAEPVSRFASGLFRLLDDMAETIVEADGAGLAAPQVGISKRIIVVRDEDNNIIELINPVILTSKGIEEDVEGCLSFPGLYGEVSRAGNIKVTGLDRNGKEFRLDAEGYLARVIQHEIDHLEGVLFVDRASHILTPEEVERLREQQQNN